jgi:hypothetical protein
MTRRSQLAAESCALQCEVVKGVLLQDCLVLGSETLRPAIIKKSDEFFVPRKDEPAFDVRATAVVR